MKPANFNLLLSIINCVSSKLITTASLKVVFKFSMNISPSSNKISNLIGSKKFKLLKLFDLTLMIPFKFLLFNVSDFKILIKIEFSSKIFFKSM